MEIKYLKQKEIDIKKWDKCISGSTNGLVYAYSWYLDVVNENWEALVYNDYEMVMPLTNKRKFGINYLYQPVFTQQLGIFSLKQLSKEIVQSFIKAIPEKYKFIEINLNKFNFTPDLKNIKVQQKITYELELIREYENIFRHYKKNTIRNIRKATKSKVSIVQGLQPNEVINLIKTSGNKQKYTENEINIIRRLIVASARKSSGLLYGAYSQNNTLCAASLFVYSNSKACFILSVSNHEAKQNGAMFLLIDEFIKQFASRNMILDFEGSMIESIARFYAGFGAQPYTYPSIKINNLFFPLRLFKK